MSNKKLALMFRNAAYTEHPTRPENVALLSDIPLLWVPLLGRTCSTCLNPPLKRTPPAGSNLAWRVVT